VGRVPQRTLGGAAYGLAFSMLCALCLLCACGRRATAADCQLIVDRSVELQLEEQNLTDASAIAERERQVRSELDDEIKSCERRRVTDKTMACVRSATSTRELDKCLH
jgi:hypothetical protein